MSLGGRMLLISCGALGACGDRAAKAGDAGVPDAGRPPGSLFWARSAGGARWDEATGVAADDEGGAYVVGHYIGPATFGRGEPNETTLGMEEDWDIFLARYAANGDLRWVRRATGPGVNFGLGVASAADGGAFVVGTKEDSLTLGEGEPGETTLTGTPNATGFLARYQPEGTLAWARRADGAWRMCAVPDGDVLISGWFSGEATFGAGEVNETTLRSPVGSNSEFLARYASDGSLLWARQSAEAPSSEGTYTRTVAAQGDGTAAIVGWLDGAATFDPDDTAIVQTSTGSSDAFVATFAAGGTLNWVTTLGDTQPDFAEGVALDASGRVTIAGGFGGTVRFGSGPRAATLVAEGTGDAFFARYDTDGSLLWARRAGGSSMSGDIGDAVAMLESGDVVFAGSFQGGRATFESPNGDVGIDTGGRGALFLARYHADGDVAWAQGIGGPDQWAFVGDLAVASDGNLLIAGRFTALTFGAGEGDETTLMSADDEIGGGDAFVAKYAP